MRAVIRIVNPLALPLGSVLASWCALALFVIDDQTQYATPTNPLAGLALFVRQTHPGWIYGMPVVVCYLGAVLIHGAWLYRPFRAAVAARVSLAAATAVGALTCLGLSREGPAPSESLILRVPLIFSCLLVPAFGFSVVLRIVAHVGKRQRRARE